MRTVILNTLGSELRQSSLFYMPFREEQFLWENVDLPGIGQVAEKICDNSSNQGQVQDYHLVVLVSLSHYGYSRYSRMRELYKQFLFVHINHQLVIPLAEQHGLPPQAVSVVYVTPHYSDGDGGVPEHEYFDVLLGFGDKDEVDTLALTTDQGATLDMSAYFSEALKDYAVSRQNEQAYAGNEAENYARQALRQALHKRLQTLCRCEYHAPGEERMKAIDQQLMEFCPKTTNWELFSVDLQMNLSDHLARRIMGEGSWELAFESHEEKEIQQRITRALYRVRKLQQSMGNLTFYPVEPLADGQGVESLPGEIWADLHAQKDLPGVEELGVLMGGKYDPDVLPDETDEDVKKLLKKAPKVWLWLPNARKQFEDMYNILKDQYNPDVAKKQQTTVLDTCARFFKDWRVRMLSRQRELPEEPTLLSRPDFDVHQARQRLAEAQQTYGSVCVEKLEDYEDLRTRAEEIKAEFRKDSRLWSKDNASSTLWFLLYSGVLAILFLLQMVAPFIGITLETNSAATSGYIHFGISLVVFALLYLLGVTIWLRGLCHRLNKHTQALFVLLQQTHLRRRQSIVAAVETYGKHLPACMIEYENWKWMEYVHEENLLREKHYKTHAMFLNNAAVMLSEMHAMLRLSEDLSEEEQKKIVVRGNIHYQCAPSDPANVLYYIFLSEKWGG